MLDSLLYAPTDYTMSKSRKQAKQLCNQQMH